MLLENGIYSAFVRDISVYLRGESERLTAAFRLDCEGKNLVHREWLELNDGTISDRTIQRLRNCFPGWDGGIDTLEEGFCVKDVEVEVTIENEQDRNDPEKWWTRVQYMNPPGGSGGTASMPAAESRATLVSRYGSRFRALAGGVQATGSPKAPTAPASTPPTAPPQPLAEPPVEPSTLEDCWEAICAKHPDELREQVSERWFELLGRIVPEKDQADFDGQDWGRVLQAIQLPF